MGLCCSRIGIPEPPTGIQDTPPPGYEYIPLEAYRVAVDTEYEEMYIPLHTSSYIQASWDDSIFT